MTDEQQCESMSTGLVLENQGMFLVHYECSISVNRFFPAVGGGGGGGGGGGIS